MYKKIVLLLCFLIAISCSSPSSPNSGSDGDIVNGGGSGSDGGNSGSGGDSGNTGDGGSTDIPWTEIAPPLPVLDEEAIKYGIDISQEDTEISKQIEEKLQAYYSDKQSYKVIFTGTPKAEYMQKNSLTKLVIEVAERLYKFKSINIEIDISNIYFNERKIKYKMFQGYSGSGYYTITFKFPENIIRIIERNAFYLINNFLKEITIPDSVIGIGAAAFQTDYKLEKVTFGADSKLEYIGDYAFSYCPISEITIPASVNYLGTKPFGDSITTVTYLGTKPDAIKHNGDVFKGYTSIQTLILPNVQNPNYDEWKNFLGGNFTTVKQR
ncbi:leucine-rich repeat domain-containing protein [Brachyspira pilosicoli]|uniref:leucine-rich repeat domain-containing protein n=1 Tax=Brachyspira pilosicoli TaxID=52584 RepID=UPI001C66BDFE|nr:leucine-rich repeat domain-containing protein [Brachyspira pilosicoli]MBW5396425.1 leucine-rich repeat domain-containing protein [Brachyspira pilosicoli]